MVFPNCVCAVFPSLSFKLSPNCEARFRCKRVNALRLMFRSRLFPKRPSATSEVNSRPLSQFSAPASVPSFRCHCPPLILQNCHVCPPCCPSVRCTIFTCSFSTLFSHFNACTCPRVFANHRCRASDACSFLRVCAPLWRGHQCVLTPCLPALLGSLTGCVLGPFFTADGDVSAKIAEELTYEKEAAIEGEPDFLKEFKTSGIWTV